jgi:two-component system response regulator FixJ
MARHVLEETVVVMGGRGDVRAFLRDHLAGEGYTVEECEIPCSLEEGWLAGPVRCVILELSSAHSNSLNLLRELRESRPDVPVLVTIDKGDVALAVAAMKSGVTGVLEKPLDRAAVVEAVAGLGDGAVRASRVRDAGIAELKLRRLSPREKEVLRLVVSGLQSKEIAGQLHLSKRTVDIHRAHLLRKLDARSVVDLVRTYVAS